jgi:hypothetical protein
MFSNPCLLIDQAETKFKVDPEDGVCMFIRNDDAFSYPQRWEKLVAINRYHYVSPISIGVISADIGVNLSRPTGWYSFVLWRLRFRSRVWRSVILILRFYKISSVPPTKYRTSTLHYTEQFSFTTVKPLSYLSYWKRPWINCNAVAMIVSDVAVSFCTD